MDAPVTESLVKRLPSWRDSARLWRRPRIARGREAGQCAALAVQVETGLAADPAFRARWQAMVEAGDSAHKLYQLPQFFDFVRDTDDGSAPVELLTVRQRANNALLAVIPVRIGSHALTFALGPLVLWRCRVSVIQLLGSTPAAGSTALPLALLAARALALFPGQGAVMLAAAPQGEVCIGRGQDILACLLASWRACHVMPLPASYDAYLQQFSAKRRYNLKRQLRQLATQWGELAVTRVEEEHHVDGLMAALAALLPAAQLPRMQRASTLMALARHGLLLCYVINAGERTVGVIMGTRSARVLHIHNIYADDSQRSLSVGTSVMQLALEDLFKMACFTLIDYGYGTPKHEFASSQALESRAPVALVSARSPLRHLLRAHRLFDLVSGRCVALAKCARRLWRA